MKKYVYMFPEGNGKMRELLGGKGANLAEMTGLGMPVPQGFTITTEACTRYYEDGKTIYPMISRNRSIEYLDKARRRSPARPSAIPRSRCSYRFVPARALPCPA